jgi:ABC-type nickel/cobalt efflux system permease component RcnA
MPSGLVQPASLSFYLTLLLGEIAVVVMVMVVVVVMSAHYHHNLRLRRIG